MTRFLICDDEPLAVERLRDLVGRVTGAEVVGTATDGRAALEAVAALRPDAVLLDIEMPALDGFDVVEALAKEAAHAPLIVFVTAYPQFAAHAFDTGAIDFLTKPVRLARLDTAVERVRRAIAERENAVRLADLARQVEQLRAERRGDAPPSGAAHLWVQRRGENVRIDLGEVDRVQSEGEYVRIYHGDASYLHREPISSLIDRFDPQRFVRIHRSHIVNRDRVASIRRRPAGGYTIVTGAGELLPVGRNYRAVVRTLVGKDE
ncbi:two component transcriptional regulator, LytTR family [Sphingomonas guangdongensis]|uniref:Two component transcriptional regulator, LytTR family n=1 Tax=Sphingomonas guangdongensis TaxID=1141890 RepID=A0A285QEJ4_9SPHN|nr:LytTR family DNA-binding domain-containing protein [Sphingomonas guangdongensis]SOB78557.1 two component transcriptional regulator, LytTR family [Sphingomonas guangdongensis]